MATSSLRYRLTPLAAALALAWHAPLYAAAPAPGTVPVPAANWRVNGSGNGNVPVNLPNGKGGTNQTINQTSARAIYNWQSFDIGASSEVLFDMAAQGASALNRVTGSTAPSQIFGVLKATNQGEIYLINPNGILFGKGAQVNTGSLIASALSIADSSYLSGFAENLQKPSPNAVFPAFHYDGDAANFVDSKNYVLVDQGATITTAAGGRVFLFAKRVDNAGTISAPGGQVVLGAGGDVFLKLPSSESQLYASETNPSVSAVRGFLVEMGNGPASGPEGGTGAATNTATGSISTPRGNTTLVGMAVNQMGRISATTSVSENGSVILRAQGNAQPEQRLDSSFAMRAQDSGNLVLGPGSRIEISPDGSTATSTDSAGFVTSHIDMAGKSVEFQSGSTLVAPGATVNVRAETTPSYNAKLTTEAGGGALSAGDPASRIVLGQDVVIDVSGTTTTERSVADLFVTTELLGSNDLKDAPLQKDGLLYRSKVTVDTRQDSAILGSLDGYRSGIERGAGERLSTGGTVNLRAEGAVLTHDSSSIRVSGGQVAYDGATVHQTRLVADNGTVYDINNAPVDLVYSSALNLEKSSDIQYNRWGQVVSYGPPSSRFEAGYVEGRAAGGVSIAAPTVLLQGELTAGTVAGTRQAAGLDKAAHAGSLTLGATINKGVNFTDTSGINNGPNAVLEQFTISASGPSGGTELWDAPMSAELPQESGIAMARLASAGFSDVTVVANGDVDFQHGGSGAFHLADGGSLRLWSGYGDVHLGQDLRGASAKVELLSRSAVRTDVNGNPDLKRSGSVEVDDGVVVDLSGRWVNQWLAGTPLTTAYTGGGRFSAGGFGVRLGEGSVVDVSGGASVSLKGVVSGAAAGAISLDDFTLPAEATGHSLVMGGALRGYSAQSSGGVTSGAGSLTLKTARVVISDSASDARDDALNLGSAFFSQGGFGSFTVDGRMSLDVAANTVIAPVQAVRQASVQSRFAASGDSAAAALADGLAPGLRRAGVNLSLASSGATLGSDADGDVTLTGVLSLGQGSALKVGPQANVALNAAHRLIDMGLIETHGGKVSLSLKSSSSTESNYLWLGAGSLIDVSGATLYTPDTTDGLLHGSVLAGGTINLSAGGFTAPLASLVLQEGARLNASGAQGQLDVTERSASGVKTTRQTVASTGGSVSISNTGDLWLEGDVDLHRGGAAVAGGSLSVNQLAGRATPALGDDLPYDPRELTLVAARQHDTASLGIDDLGITTSLTGRAVVARDWFAASGASDLTLASAGVLRAAENVDLHVERNLQLRVRGLAAEPGTAAHFDAANAWLGTAPVTDGLAGSANSLLALTATQGDATLQVSARAGMVLDGHLVTQGLGQLNLASGGDLRLQSREGLTGGQYTGRLDTLADLSISAAQVYPATDTQYTIQATGHAVTFSGGDSSAAKPVSANGNLIVNAAAIEQDGVLRAPLGHIELHGSESVTLGARSETSVSADGLTLLYGTANSTSSSWTSPAATALTTPPDKQIVLEGASVTTKAGSVFDVSGGGELVGTEFVPGKGGSTDITAASGSFAIVPKATGLGPHDPQTTLAEAALGKQLVITQAVKLGDGSVLPPGHYTLLPARYAMLDGAFLVRKVANAGLADGTAVARTDGSADVGARLGDAGTTLLDAQPATWQVMSKGIVLKYSEIRETTATQFFADKAAHAGTALPELARDGGSLEIRAQQADLQGAGRFASGKDGSGTAGRAGNLAIVASAIEVDATQPPASDDGVLHLSAAQLNQFAGGTVILGARTNGAGENGTLLDVQAQSVVFDQGANALTLSGLVAAATDTVSVRDGAVFASAARPTASAGVEYAVDGNGAALLLDADRGHGLTRTGVIGGNSASLDVGAGAVLDAAQGSLALDSSGASRIARDATLKASDALISAQSMVAGAAGQVEGSLALTPAQLASLGQAERLTLRAYERLRFTSGTTLGTPALGELVLDTPLLSVNDASAPVQVTAGQLTLTNTSGATSGAAPGGDAALTLHASSAEGGSGLLRLGEGNVAVAGASQLTLAGDKAIALAGAGQLVASNDVLLQAPGVIAADAAASHLLQTPGQVRIEAGGEPPLPASEAGSVFSVAAQAIEMSGRIVLPSGQVTLAGNAGVHLSSSARINTAGRPVALDDQTVDQAGGRVALSSALGDVALDAGSYLDVSGSGTAGRGGSLSLSASQGEVLVGGQIAGKAGAQAPGASLAIDAGSNLQMVQLSNKIADGEFTDSISLRQREGDLNVAPVVALKSRAISIEADGGALTVAGTLDASGKEAGSITLSASGDLALHAGSQLLASASGAGENGGRVALESSNGWVRFTPTSLIDVHAGAATDTTTPEGGRLDIRARQRGGTDVFVGALSGSVLGASRIDVQAVKVYRGFTSIGDFTNDHELGTGQIAADAASFLGNAGSQAEQIAQRLLAGNAGLSDALKIHAEAEVRTLANLAVTDGADWALPTESVYFPQASHVGDTSLTLRAGGDLTLGRGISSGLDIYSGSASSDNGGSVRLIAGADLAAAHVATTGAARRTLTLAPESASPFNSTMSVTGSSTGDLTLAASGDIDIAKSGTYLQTTGRRADEAAVAAQNRIFQSGTYGTLFGGQGGGDIQLAAGGDINSVSWQPFGVGYDGVAIWSWSEATNGDLGWRLNTVGRGAGNSFNRGVLSGGGGAVDVRAGRDINNLIAVAASTGYRLEATEDGTPAQERHFSGGSVRVNAGRDVADGMLAAGGAELDVRAGRDVAWHGANNTLNRPGTRLYYEDTAVHVDARRDITLGLLTSRFATYDMDPAKNIQGLDGNAGASVLATAGDLQLKALTATPQDNNLMLLPDRTRLAAPVGDIAIDATLLQQPQADGVLTVLAGHDLTVHGMVTVNATQTSQRPGARLESVEEALAEANVDLNGLWTDGTALQDQSGRSPVQFVAGSGNLAFNGDLGVFSARPLRLVAGNDLYLSGLISVQQQADAATGAWNEQTLLKAGRDILFHDSQAPGIFGSLQVAGPGEVTLLAGRDIDLGAFNRGNVGSGVTAVGNTKNGLLPSQSASVTLVAGERVDGGDYAQAVARGFEVVGASALAARAGDLYALLSGEADKAAPRRDASSPLALDSAAAKAFDAKSTSEQLAAVKALMGDAAYNQALAAYVRSLPGNNALSDAQALATFTTMTPARQEAAPGSLLSGQFATASADTRHAFLAQVASADTPRYADALRAWMRQTTGQDLALDGAIVAFEALPVERQLGWLNQMLIEEVRSAGRVAAVSTGVDKEAAYLRGYLAIDTVFPGLRPEGDIRLPSTEVKTLQSAGLELVAKTATQHALQTSGITLLAPGGMVNAGEVSASGQAANNLGVVTVAGGDISAISKQDFLVNQSRVFSLAQGDVLLWSSDGDIDAGRGAKTVTGAPAPVLRLDPVKGFLYLDTSGSFSGSGIAVLDAGSDLDLYAPTGAIDAGEAGIRARGNVFIGAVVVRGADNIQIGGNASGTPIGAVPVTLPATLAPLATDANAARNGDDEEERRKRLRARRNLLLDFLGYGRG